MTPEYARGGGLLKFYGTLHNLQLCCSFGGFSIFWGNFDISSVEIAR